MLVDTRLNYTGNDAFDPQMRTRQSISNPKEMLISVTLSSGLVQGSSLVSHELHITMDVEKTKLLIARLQEGVDRDENKA